MPVNCRELAVPLKAQVMHIYGCSENQEAGIGKSFPGISEILRKLRRK